MIGANTPVIIGIGQVTDRIGDPDYRQLSEVQLASAASKIACRDAASSQPIIGRIDVIAATRTMADTMPQLRSVMAPFGTPTNFTASVAAQVGASPQHCIYSHAGGSEPQRLLGEIATRIDAGEFELGLICGAEAISTIRAAKASGMTLDWSDDAERPRDDRGIGLEDVTVPYFVNNGLASGPAVYALLEHARRGRLGLSREAYAQEMGRLFATFTDVAAANSLAAVRRKMDPAAISSESIHNRLIADPYTKCLVARDQVNLGAAVLIASTKTADALGVPLSKRAYIKGFAYTKEISLVERIDLGRSYAMNVSYAAALEAAGVRADSISYFDLYSCFPISVFAAIDAMRLDPADPRRFTVTGGLPYFGGPGNNYALHAIASMVDIVRQDSDALGLVGAVGGILSSHAVGVYSAKPSPWVAVDGESLQQRVVAQPRVRFDWAPAGAAHIETYTVLYNQGIPADAIIFGRLLRDGSRILANLGKDHATAAKMAAEDVLGRRVYTATEDGLSRFSFDRASAG